jgi:hypothetical protein
LMNDFVTQFNTLNCVELTGVKLVTAEGQAEFVETKKVDDCTKYVGETARMVVEIVDGM